MPERHKRGHRTPRKRYGEYLHKRALFKVIVGEKVFRIPFVAPAGQAYSQENIKSLTERVINYIDEKFSRLEFKQVQVAENQINFIATGHRPPQGEQSERQSSTGNS